MTQKTYQRQDGAQAIKDDSGRFIGTVPSHSNMPSSGPVVASPGSYATQTVYGVLIHGTDGRDYSFVVSNERKLAELLRDSSYVSFEITEEAPDSAPRVMDPVEASVFAERAIADLPENKPLQNPVSTYAIKLGYSRGDGSTQEFVFPAETLDALSDIVAKSELPQSLEITETRVGTIDGEDGLFTRHETWDDKDAVNFLQSVPRNRH